MDLRMFQYIARCNNSTIIQMTFVHSVPVPAFLTHAVARLAQLGGPGGFFHAACSAVPSLCMHVYIS